MTEFSLPADCARDNLSVGSRPMNHERHDAATRPAGMEHAGVIDFFAHDKKSDEVLLVMFEPRPWDNSERQLFQMQEKFNAYVSFLLDGELAETHPDLAGKNARIELRCAEIPGGPALDLLSAIHDQLALQEIRVEVIAEDRSGGCRSGCACH